MRLMGRSKGTKLTPRGVNWAGLAQAQARSMHGTERHTLSRPGWAVI